MRKAIQIIAVACLLVVGLYVVYWYVGPTDKVMVADKVVATDNCEDNICFGFGLNWQTATRKNVRDWLDAMGDVNAKDKSGETPLHFAARYTKSPAIISTLLEAGADVNTEDKSGNTPLHYAIHAAVYDKKKNQGIPIPFILINAGADTTAKDKHGHTPFYYGLLAIDKEKPGTIKSVIDSGRDLEEAALSAYEDYTIKPKATSALAEITPGKTGVEVALSEGRTPSLVPSDAGFIGLTKNSGSYCGTIELISAGTPASYALKCTITRADPAIIGKTVTWNRDASGQWECTTTITESKYKPEKCT